MAAQVELEGQGPNSLTEVRWKSNHYLESTFEVTPMFAFSMKRLQSMKNRKTLEINMCSRTGLWKSACKTKQKNGTGRRGCPSQIVNLPCVPTLCICKCGTCVRIRFKLRSCFLGLVRLFVIETRLFQNIFIMSVNFVAFTSELFGKTKTRHRKCQTRDR